MGSTAHTVAAETPRAVLLLQQGEKIRGPILVTYGGLLVLSGTRLSIQIETIQALLDQIDCPILLIRSSGV